MEASGEPAFTRDDLRNLWRILSPDERLEGFRLLPHDDAEDFFLTLARADHASLMLELPKNERRAWMRLLPPDDAADLIQHVPEAERDGLLSLLDDTTRNEVTALLAYAEDEAGGLMNPRYARLRPEMTVDEAISYLRRQARDEHRDCSRTCTCSTTSSSCSAWSRSASCSPRSPSARCARSCAATSSRCATTRTRKR